MSKVKIVNVVATALLNQGIDFDELRKLPEIFYDSDVYGGRVAYFKAKNMEGKVSIFISGKMISIGTNSQKKAFDELETAKIFLVENNLIQSVELQPRIQNIVVLVDLEQNINIEKLSEVTRGVYEPEQFAGLVIKKEKSHNFSMTIFASGKAIIAGLKSFEQVIPAAKELEEITKDAN